MWLDKPREPNGRTQKPTMYDKWQNKQQRDQDDNIFERQLDWIVGGRVKPATQWGTLGSLTVGAVLTLTFWSSAHRRRSLPRLTQQDKLILPRREPFGFLIVL